MPKLLCFAFTLFAVVGCGRATSTSGPDQMQSALVGSWLSDGADVAPLLAAAPFNYTRITADFAKDETYVVTGTDKSGKTTTFTGTYSETPSATPGLVSITVQQVQPATTLAEGIYRVDGALLTYEVVQTQPTNGLQPPTADAGFGSTVYNGKMITTLIQKFQRQ
jgi:hypothetical protein